MKRLRRSALIAGGCVAALFLFVALEYLVPGRPSIVPMPAKRPIVAHRGIHQNYEKGVYDLATGCEARHIFPPSHLYIENTVESVGATFAAGAAIVEIDIRRSSDDHLVVMHDSLLDCRTNGTGRVRDHDLAYLKRLDIGYGYTPDGGQTYPLRGKGVGKMATLGEILQAYPNGSFLIDHKDGDERSTLILLRVLETLPDSRLERLWYWGPEETLAMIRKRFPGVHRLFPLRWQVKQSFVPFFVSFGLIPIPSRYRGLVLPIPVRYHRWIWGWPYRFIRALHRQGTRLYLYVDTREEAERYGGLPVDGFVTDYIEVTGGILAPRVQ